MYILFFFFFFQAEDGIRDLYVTGVQTCALPISQSTSSRAGGSLTMVIRTSAEAATSRGFAAALAPAATKASARAAVRFQTVRGKPALRKLKPIGRPIKPRPINPTFVCDTSVSQG